MRNKMIVAAAMAFAASVANISVASVPASATGFQNIVLCNRQINPLCMAGYDGDGGLVKQFPYSTGASEDVNVTVLSNCGGGMVTSTCPFTDTDLDRAYIHSSIVSITNKANKMTYNGDWVNQNIKETSDGGTGQVWVQAGDLGGGVNHEAGLINVYASDKQGDAEYACTSGASGGDLALEASQSGLDPNQCTWQEYPGGN